MCRVKCKTQFFIIINVYVFANASQKLKWLRNIIQSFKHNEIVYFCDVIKKNFNQFFFRMNRKKRVTSASFQIIALNKLFIILNKRKCDYVDEWRIVNSKLITYIYYKQNVNIFKINKIYLRSELMKNASNWKITASEIHTNHHAVKMSLNNDQFKNRESERWRLNSFLLKLQTMQDQIINAISCLFKNDFMSEWMIFKILIKKKLQKRAREFERSTFKLQRKLN